jgi:uncharacterized membrane protein HdeD (DUF308 family)
MLEAVTRNWWAVGLRGLLGILFGIAAIAWPAAALWALIIVFGAYALVDGVFALVEAVMHWRESRRWPLLIEGILGIIFGAIALVTPVIAVLAWVYVIAAWALVTGVLEVVNAIHLRKQISGEIWMLLSGLISIVFGLLLAFWPLQGALAVTWIIGIYAVIFGIFFVVLAFKLKGVNERTTGRLGPQGSAA